MASGLTVLVNPLAALARLLEILVNLLTPMCSLHGDGGQLLDADVQALGSDGQLLDASGDIQRQRRSRLVELLDQGCGGTG